MYLWSWKFKVFLFEEPIKPKIRQNVWAFVNEHAGVCRKDVWCKEMGGGERSVEDKGNFDKRDNNWVKK